MTNQPKKLIEVAMPVKEISAESVRDKSIRHGHISTLHLWWARRPLPVCRAVVFASLVPDPLDPNCPKAFSDAVELLLGSKDKPLNEPGMWVNAYKPYENIPYTSAIDKMEDNLRNRLLMFIGKFSSKYEENERNGKTTPAKDLLSDYSLIKWDNKNNEAIINKARKLIWVTHNAETGKTAKELLTEFDLLYNAIKDAENKLYETSDRHIKTDDITEKQGKLDYSINAFLNKMPKVFDPFAGGGAIPLEAARLGCKSYGNDLNPVAHIIQKGSVEFPQKYGKPITYSIKEFRNKYGEDELEKIPHEDIIFNNGVATSIKIANRLSFDVKFYANKLLKLAKEEIGQFYPEDENGNMPVAYYWARVGKCTNPSCNAEVPLLRQFYLANTSNKKIYLKPLIQANKIDFEICQGEQDYKGWISRGNLNCPCCGNVTDVKTLKKQFIEKSTSERLLAVIWEERNGKNYRIPSNEDINSIVQLPLKLNVPSEEMPIKYTQALPSCTWGLSRWGEMFTKRQLYAIQTFVEKLQNLKSDIGFKNNPYNDSIITYLGILIDRVVARLSSYGLWHAGRETLEYPFGRQAIPMVFDFPESNPFCTSSGSAMNQIDWIVRYINSECHSSFSSQCNNAASGDKFQFDGKSLNAVVTDPPYYDAIAYGDLSDFFYIWLKRCLGDVFPNNFAFPLTPKTEECTALKHHHLGNLDKAKIHFEKTLSRIFKTMEIQTRPHGIVSIMFAHQSTEAWTTLCNSILGSNMNISGSWALDSEYSNSGLKSSKAFLTSSVTVTCRPTSKNGFGQFKEIRHSIEEKVIGEVRFLYSLGFRGADLLTACFSKAVNVFGQYEKVEKADGSEVSVAELLKLAREAAFNAIISDIDTDEITRFYIGWLNLFGYTQADHDDVQNIVKIGLTIEINDLIKHHILIKEGNKQVLADFKERNSNSNNLGEKDDSFMIDKIHKAIFLFEGTNHQNLVSYIANVDSKADSDFWRVLYSVSEVLPKGTKDFENTKGLLAIKDSLIKEAQRIKEHTGEQQSLF